MINNKWIIKRHHPSVTTVLVSAGCCVEGREANTKLHQVSCRTKPVRGLAQGAQSPCGDTLDANSMANYTKNGAKNGVSQTERAGSWGQIVILGLLSDRRLHRCGDDKPYQWLITRVARGGDDRRSPEQKWLLVSLQTGLLGEMDGTNASRMRWWGPAWQCRLIIVDSLFFLSNSESNFLLTSYLWSLRFISWNL